MSLETNISKEAIFLMTKEPGLFFLVISSMTNIKKRLLRVQDVSDICRGSRKIIPLVAKRLLKTQ